MIFSTFALDDAKGVLLALTLETSVGRFKKGHRLGSADITVVRAVGQTEVVGARLDPGDANENSLRRV